jgi:type I restriction enzyme M protein
MITGQLKSDIDKLWEAFWTGGITNPLTVIEQISFLMFLRMLDMQETRNEKRARRTGHDFDRAFRAEPDPDKRADDPTRDEQKLRWSNFKHLGGKEMLPLVRDGAFAHLRSMGGGTSFGEFMKDAQMMIQRPSLLSQAVAMVDALPLDRETPRATCTSTCSAS